ncbi:MAG: hypothetical protein ACI3YB_06935, partial [Prevotella sp.]
MKKYALLILLALCSISIFAQSSMTDSQVMNFIVTEHQKGSSQQQIVTKLMQHGVDINQIRRVRSMYEKMKNGSGGATGTAENAGKD